MLSVVVAQSAQMLRIEVRLSHFAILVYGRTPCKRNVARALGRNCAKTLRCARVTSRSHEKAHSTQETRCALPEALMSL